MLQQTYVFQDPRKVIVLVEQTFRGETHPEPVQLDETTYKPDYVLIHKDQEEKYRKITVKPEKKVVPRITDLPPLLKELLLREAREQRKDAPDLNLKLQYNLSGFKNYKVAEEGNTPTIDVSIGLGKPRSPTLYENIKGQNPS